MKVLESLTKIVLCGKQGQALVATVMIKSIGWKMTTHIPMKVTSWNWYKSRLKQTLSLLNTLLSPHKMHTTHPERFEMN